MARKILLADDSVTAQNMGRKILADAGYEVITVNNGSAALKKITEQKPDLIVLDVYMPGYSGLEVCQRLKEAHDTSRTPVLLTVGKLEPFKPEEAKRVRAEGFIVKPFEASELLSALAKLEDKIVPRTESSKPGRFARAIAAVEESGRSGGNGSEEDSGWKNRISFPSKKKAKPEAEDGDDPAIYNAVNRDLRTVVQHEAASKEKDEAAAFDNKVDVAALGAPGVPRDVSAEEIAAIAAAAAQVQATISAAQQGEETKPSDGAGSTVMKPVAADSENSSLERLESEKTLEIQSAAATETPQAANAVPAVSTEVTASATFADRATEKTETDRGDSGETQREQRGEDRSEMAGPVPTNEMTAAIAAVPGNGDSWSSGGSTFDREHSAEEVPVTMAAGSTGTEERQGRWMAIPVAIDPDEAAISLELEMQKAYAAFAAAEANSPGFVSSIPELAERLPEVAAAPPEPTAPAPGSSAEPTSALPARDAQPAPPDSMSVVASASVEVFGEAVTELTAVAASRFDPPSQSPAGSEQINSDFNPQTTSTFDVGEVAEPVAGQNLAIPSPHAEEPHIAAEPLVQPASAETWNEAVARETRDIERMVAESTAVQTESAAGGKGEMADERDSELAASTAAAWASWRQIRETAQPQASADPRNAAERDFGDDDASSTRESAMAVAAGAEKALEDASAAEASDPAAIASIVDSVLADLRPKIVEEISRKLGKKKK